MGSPFPINTWADQWEPSLSRSPDDGSVSGETESLEDYLARVRPLVGHLPKPVIEQWIYRHFRYTEYRNIPLEKLTAQPETWQTDKILAIGSVFAPNELQDELGPTSGLRNWQSEPALAFRAAGTWDFPILIMEHEDGFLDEEGILTPYKYWLIEGRLRFRFLNYWHDEGKANDKHKVWVIKIAS